MKHLQNIITIFVSIQDRLSTYKHMIIILLSMAQSTKKIRIIAQPQAIYRERYMSETDTGRCRYQRYIRAEKNSAQLQYPTIEVMETF